MFASGFPVRPWVFDAYAPAGAVVSTAGDLTRLATAILEGRAPGLSALEPTAATSEADTGIGIFWHVTTTPGQTIAWHQGLTGGYSAYLGIDLTHQRAVVLLSDVAVPGIQELGGRLLERW
jgi:CubicO group peptidase (beta-lactamase class C family)